MRWEVESAGEINNQFYNYDLNGFVAFQYACYNSGEKGTFHWHMDMLLDRKTLPPGMIELYCGENPMDQRIEIPSWATFSRPRAKCWTRSGRGGGSPSPSPR